MLHAPVALEPDVLPHTRGLPSNIAVENERQYAWFIPLSDLWILTELLVDNWRLVHRRRSHTTVTCDLSRQRNYMPWGEKASQRVRLVATMAEACRPRHAP